ncbi:MAG TPA: Uma2 family endonuclease [Pirellulales bacterium]|nr:Uma2 family endonuclease [Pirellulales bacterium]
MSISNVTPGLTPKDWPGFLTDILPRQGNWSDEEYLVLTEQTNRLVEFTDGFLEELPMPTERHQAMVEYLFDEFRAYIKPRGGKARFAPLRLQIRPGKYREPDILLVLSLSDPRRQDRFWRGADLAIEVVSPDKPERDLVEKPADYAEGGVQEYWIVNPIDETISVLRLGGATYVEAGMYRRGDAASSVLLPGFSLDVAAVFEAE